MNSAAHSLDYQSRDIATAKTGYVPSLHCFALLTVAATFPLIFMGGLVTSHGAGMSVPDWPNSYGYNMFTFPPSQWVGGIFYEHTHRLMGTVVGMLSIALTIWAWRTEPRRWVRWLATGVLGAVIFQGVLGGLRVVMVELDLAIVHACFAQAFFCLAVFTAIVTSRWWIEAPQRAMDQPALDADVIQRLFKFSAIAVAVIYLQLIVGAVMRHYEAGLAMSLTELLPPASIEALDAANAHHAFDLHLPPVSMAQVWLHFGHRIGAVLVSAVVIATIVLALRSRGRTRFEHVAGAFFAAVAGLIGLAATDVLASTHGWTAGLAVFITAVAAFFILRAFLRRLGEARPVLAPAALLAALLLVQVTLGLLTVYLRKPADVASAHVAVGALTLVTAFALCIRCARLSAIAIAHCKAAGSARGDFSQELTNDSVSNHESESVLAA
jgi:cytochrome c oxidase assembly protein subunit 15